MAHGQRARRREHARDDRGRLAHWRQVFAEQTLSGLSHSEYCRQHSISLNTYFWWKRELPRKLAGLRTEDAPGLVAVKIRQSELSGPISNPAGFEVVLHGGRVLRVAPGFDADELRRLVSLLEDCRC